jgi:hypothetical protein
MKTTRYVLLGTACVLFGAAFLRATQSGDWLAAVVGAAVLLGCAGVIGKLMERA